MPVQWHNNSCALGFTPISARSTADVWSRDITTGKVDRWTKSETGGLNTATFPEPELISWPSFDHHTITGFHYRPPPLRSLKAMIGKVQATQP